jgi:Ca2+-binding EF-hand superfamily protein
MNYYNQVSANLPNSILEKLRKSAFPSKRESLQKSLCGVDKEGDGYISKKQFVEAIYEAGV